MDQTKTSVPVGPYCCYSRLDVDNATSMPPTSRPTGAYSYHHVDPLSPSARSAPSAVQYDTVKTGPGEVQAHRRPLVCHTDPQPNSWITDITVSLAFSVCIV